MRQNAAVTALRPAVAVALLLLPAAGGASSAWLGTQTPSGRTLQALSYGYDPVGNVTAQVNALGPPTATRSGAVTFGFEYDDLHRLTGATGKALSRPGVVDRFEASFAYSDIHNMTRKRQVRELNSGGVVERPAPSNHDFTYLYEGPGPHQATRIDGTVLTYDASGNTQSECKSPPGTTCASGGGGGGPEESGARLRRYVWTEQSWLRAVIDGGGKNETRFLYDASGQRVAKLGRGGTSLTVGQFYSTRGASVATKHIYAGETRLASKVISPPSFKVGAGGPKWAGYLPGCEPSQHMPKKCVEPSGGATGVELSGGMRPATYYYHSDHLGSTGWITDQGGRVREHLEYFPYGEVWRDVRGDAEAGPQPGPKYRFTGKELDEETGLTYFGARYYDSRKARWTSADPILIRLIDTAEPRNYSLYLYANSNPLRYVDPDGRCAVVAGGYLDCLATARKWDAELSNIISDSLADGSYGSAAAAYALGLLNGAVYVSGGALQFIVASPYNAGFKTSEGFQQENYDQALVGSTELVLLGVGGKLAPKPVGRGPSASSPTAPAAAKGIPQITSGTNREMLGQAMGHLKGMKGSAADKANAFEQMASQISQKSVANWSAARGLGSDGSHVFLGEAGEALVISPQGQVFRGSLGSGIRQAGTGKFSVDYSKLLGIE